MFSSVKPRLCLALRNAWVRQVSEPEFEFNAVILRQLKGGRGEGRARKNLCFCILLFHSVSTVEVSRDSNPKRMLSTALCIYHGRMLRYGVGDFWLGEPCP